MPAALGMVSTHPPALTGLNISSSSQSGETPDPKPAGTITALLPRFHGLTGVWRRVNRSLSPAGGTNHLPYIQGLRYTEVQLGYNPSMRRKLSKHGNSWAFVIEKPIMELLGFTPETEFEVKTNGGQLVLSPVAEITPDELRTSFEKIATRYDKSLRNLAK
jgi:antitoxin component of MazEF toxin-antitoxin module